MSSAAPPTMLGTPWSRQASWPLDLSRYDRTPTLSPEERQALAAFALPRQDRAVVIATAEQQGELTRLLLPVRDAVAVLEGDVLLKTYSLHLLLRLCAREGQPWWAWDQVTWVRMLGTSTATFYTTHQPGNATDLRQYVIGVAYLLTCFCNFHALGGIETVSLASKVFGRAHLEATFAPLLEVNTAWGYSQREEAAFCSVIAETLLLSGSPETRHLTLPFLKEVHAVMAPIPRRSAMVYRLSRILAHLHLLEQPLPLHGGLKASTYKAERERGVAPEWSAGVERWFTTSLRPRTCRLDMRRDLLRVGRWLAVHHPEVTTPAQFTRELAAELVAATTQMRIGELSCDLPIPIKAQGQSWSAPRKHNFLGVLRRCFSDAQEWGWIERIFTPQRVFATPRSIRWQLRVAPRIIADDIWAKLLWAGLNLRAEDCPIRGHHRTPRQAETETQVALSVPEGAPFYPIEMLRALAILWLFAGLRSDELSRLRVGSARLQTVVTGDDAASSPAPPEATETTRPVCLLAIPTRCATSLLKSYLTI